MAIPKLLVPVAAVAGLSLTCLGLRTETKVPPNRDEITHEVSRSRDQKVVRTILNSEPDPSVLKEEELWQKRYESRCITEFDGNRSDFNLGCDQTVRNLADRLNSSLRDVQVMGRLEEVEDFKFCPQFHWVDEYNSTGYDMLAAPGAHSHYEHYGMDCVSSINVYMEEEYPNPMVCALTTLCEDRDGKRVNLGPKSTFQDRSCDMRTNPDILGMLAALREGLKPIED